MVGIKKSQFISNGTAPIDGSATFDFVINGQNVKITYDNLLPMFGTTGALQQEGDPLGSPVLDDQGVIKGIRNIEDGAGILSEISAQNGITLKHNFIQDTVGSPVLLNPTAASPAIASIVGGDNITVTPTNNSIEISSGIDIEELTIQVDNNTMSIAEIQAELEKSDEIAISSLSDLPAPVSGVITIGAGAGYAKIRVFGNVDISPNTLAISGFCQISGNNGDIGLGDGFITDAANATIDVGSAALFLNRVGIFSVNDSLLNVDSGVVVAIQCFFDGPYFGDLSNVTIFLADKTRFSSTSSGFNFTNDSNNEVIFSTCNLIDVAGDFLNFGTAKIRNIDIDSCAWVQKQDNSNALISGLGDDNIIPGGRLSVQNTRAVIQNGEEIITGITNSNPAAVTVSGTTSRVDGEYINIRSVDGMTEINTAPGEGVYKIINSTGPIGNIFELENIDSTLFGVYSSGGVAEVDARVNLVGFSTSMTRGEFFDNTGLKDSDNAANVYFEAAPAVTTINDINVPENMAGSFISSISERATVDGDGVITNRSREPISFEYTIDATIEKIGGGADLIKVGAGLKRNGPDNFDSQFIFQIGAKGSQSSAPTSVHCKLAGTINPGEQLRPMVVNTGSTSNINVLDCYCSFNGK